MTSRERLLWAAFERIKARPEEWNQTSWVCGSVGCLGFHVCCAADPKFKSRSGGEICRKAIQLLGLQAESTGGLFSYDFGLLDAKTTDDKIEWLRQHITTWLEKHGSDGKEVRAL